eukprot:SAG31_NODE_1350_length_8681_cov_14.408879_6_plen_137_part_00
MIERHYFKDKLIKSFDFTFPFCIPNSTNSWEAVYELPKLTEEEVPFPPLACRHATDHAAHSVCDCRALPPSSQRRDIINSPMQSKSDSVRNQSNDGLAATHSLLCSLILPLARPQFYFVDDKLIMHTKAEYAYGDQ